MRKAITMLTMLVFVLSTLMLSAFSAHGSIIDEVATRNRQIEEIQKQIEQYQQELDALGGQSATLQNTIAKLNANINQVQLEIRSLNLSIAQTDAAIGDTQLQIQAAQDKISLQKATLAKLITELYRADKQNLTQIFFKNKKLSDFFNDIDNIRSTQENIQSVLDSIKATKSELEKNEAELEEKQNDLERQKNLQQIEKRTLDQTKTQQATILKQTKNQESKFQDLVKKSKKDIEAIRSQITYLQQNGVTAEDAVKYGQLAAIAVGIRPAFLIAELEVESGLGRNVGRCNRAGDPPEKSWKVVMHTRDHTAFTSITSSLGLDPNTTPVSCRQIVNGRPYGWGGAMGPAQFIPSTWMGYKDQVTKITGHNPANPWNIEDAFMASAVKLARAGATAKTRAAEVYASKSYYSGRGNCSTAQCNSYANAVQRTAAIIEQNL